MMDDTRIEAVIRQVMAELGQGERRPHAPMPEVDPGQASAPAHPLRHGDNLFPDVDSAVAAARQAFDQLMALPLDLREQMISHVRRAARENAQILAREAWEETGLGRLEDKIQKNLLNADKVPGTEVLVPTSWTGDHGLTLVEYAPFGVIGAIIPTTNPTSTVIGNSLAMVAAGNAVVFNAHPSAKASSNHTVQLVGDAIVEAGGPPNLVCAVAEPTIDTAQELMRHRGVRLLTVTGGAGVVKAAMQSGKRAICAGPGNPPVVVDETADIDQAGQGIVRGGSFDNNIVCIDEKEIFVVASVADELKRSMVAHGALEIDSDQAARLTKAVFAEVPPPASPAR